MTESTTRGIAGVAVAMIGSTACAGGSLFYRGMPHAALGDATLSLDTDNLVISGIGATGLDGVNIGLGLARGFHAAPDIGQAGALAPGTMFRMETIAPVGGRLDVTSSSPSRPRACSCAKTTLLAASALSACSFSLR